jgi:hypothetical protein
MGTPAAIGASTDFDVATCVPFCDWDPVFELMTDGRF